MSRPRKYDPTTRVRLAPDGSTKLQIDSDRRAVVQIVLDLGGKASLQEISTRLGFDGSAIVRGLIRSNWLAAE